MKNLAQLDENNKVINISLADNEWLQEGWIEFTEENPASIGYEYDPIDKAFIAPMPTCGHDALTLNQNHQWECIACQELAKGNWPE